MTLFITGDIALPRLKDIPNFESVKNLTKDNVVISNLEGSIVEDKFVNDYFLIFNLKTNWLVIRHKLIIFLKKLI